MFTAKNLTAFRFDPALKFPDLQETLEPLVLREPGPLELETIGFVSPVAEDSDVLARLVGTCTGLAVGVRKKIVPTAVLNERLNKRIRELADREGRKVGGKERKRLREEILTDMLGKAFVKYSSTRAWIDHENGWFIVDTASRPTAELVVSTLRKALGSFPAVPVTAGQVSPSLIFAEWLQAKEAAPQLGLGDECVLECADAGSTWAGKKVDLVGEEVAEHLEAGGRPRRLGLSFDDRLTFVLDNDLVVRKLNFLDVVLDARPDDVGDEIGAFDANLVMVSREVAALLARLSDVFQIEGAG